MAPKVICENSNVQYRERRVEMFVDFNARRSLSWFSKEAIWRMFREGDLLRLASITNYLGEIPRDRELSRAPELRIGWPRSPSSTGSSKPITLENSDPRSDKLMLSTGSDSLKI